jgi:D-hydroxyproline dehydrogenase
MAIQSSFAHQSAHVIGGGIVGLNVALALQERGFKVRLSEQAPSERAASWGNAGHVAVEQVEPLASWANIKSLHQRLYCRGGAASFPPKQIGTWLPFGLRLMRAANRFGHGKQALSALLAQALPAWQRQVTSAGLTHLLKEQGHIIAWESAASAQAGLKHWSNVDTGTARWRELSSNEMHALQARLTAPLAHAIQFEGSAQVADPGQVLSALAAQFLNLGGQINDVAARLDERTLASADLTVVCAGVHSGMLMQQLGHNVPIIAERGYHIQAHIQAHNQAHNQASGVVWPSTMPPIVFDDRSIVVTGFNSGLRATSFVEFSTPQAPPDQQKWERLKKHVQALGLPFTGYISEWIGCRPTFPDYLPAIGRSSRDSRVLYAFGHQHLGLTLAPVTGELIAQLACGEPSNIDLAAFSLDRF